MIEIDQAERNRKQRSLAGQSLVDITGSVQSINNLNSKVAGATEKLTKNSMQIVENIRQIEDISHRVVECSKEISNEAK